MVALSERRILNIGCGRGHIPDAVNIDVTDRTGPDVVHDLNQRPWPFADDRFDVLHARDVIEHLDDTVAAMEEIHRVCRPGATVHLTVPHFSAAGAFTDPTHRRFFSLSTFDYFTDAHPNNFYSACRFRPHVVQLIFHPRLGNKLLWRLANRFPSAYEERWAWIFPARLINAQLEVVKP
jgi:SAM-dependent methyltransferase